MKSETFADRLLNAARIAREAMERAEENGDTEESIYYAAQYNSLVESANAEEQLDAK